MRETKTPQKLFAKFNNNTYRPPRLKVNQDDLDYNSRLCAFFIILKTVDKEKFLNIKFVKKSCLETLLF